MSLGVIAGSSGLKDTLSPWPTHPRLGVEVGGAAGATEPTHTVGSGEIGVISSVTQAFCSTCTRARLSVEGKLYTCLFAQSGHDLRALTQG